MTIFRPIWLQWGSGEAPVRTPEYWIVILSIKGGLHMHSRSVMSLEQFILTNNTGLFGKYDVFWSNLETKEKKAPMGHRWGYLNTQSISFRPFEIKIYGSSVFLAVKYRIGFIKYTIYAKKWRFFVQFGYNEAPVRLRWKSGELENQWKVFPVPQTNLPSS